MTIFHAKHVTTQSFSSPNITFKLSSSGQTYTANWNTDVNASVSTEHTIAPTIITVATPQTGWLWLRRGWLMANGLYLATDPKRPKAFGTGDVYYKTHGRVLGVRTLVVLEEDNNHNAVLVNLHETAEISPTHPLPAAVAGERSEFWLTSSFLVKYTDVDFDGLETDEDGAEAASKQLGELLDIPPPDPAFITQYARARSATRTILEEYADSLPDPPVPSLIARWKQLARAAHLDKVPASERRGGDSPVDE
jgi:hypothetical protein